MHAPLPVWSTLSEAFAFVQHRFIQFLEAMWLPALILVGIQLIYLFLVSDPASPVHYLFDFGSLLVFAWMMNVTCRIVIQDQPGAKLWTSAETWTAVWLVCLSFVITVFAALPAMLAFGAFYFFSPVMGITAAGLTFLILHFYLFARFVLVFPATALGDKTSFRDAWEMSSGNGWRLVILFALVPFLYCLVAAFLGILLPVRLFITLLSILGVFFALVGVVALSLAYKKLVS